MSNKPGRNEPCPCGSGKKYKKCCGAREAVDFSIPKDLRTGTLLDDYMMLVQGIMMFAQTLRQFDDDRRALNAEIQNFEKKFKPGKPDGIADSIFMSWNLLDIRFGISQKTICERFIESEWAERLREPAPILLKNLARSYMAFYRLESVSDDSLLFEEIGTGRTWRIHRVNEPYERSATPRDIWYVRFLGEPEDAFIFTAPLIFSPETDKQGDIEDGINIQKEAWTRYKERTEFEDGMFADSCKAAVNSWLGIIMGVPLELFEGSSHTPFPQRDLQRSKSMKKTLRRVEETADFRINEGERMEIKFTKEQYDSLVKMIYLGDWMINAIRVDDRVRKFDDLKQYTYSFYREFGLEKHIVHDEKLGGFFPTRELEAELEKYMQEYEDEVFWDELADRLASRDLLRELGESGIKKMSNEERFSKICDLTEKYEKEAERYGIERLEIKDNGGS